MTTFSNSIGWIGASLVILAYLLVSNNKISGRSRIYQFMNLAGAIGVGVNALYQRAWPSFGIQIAWGVIAIIAILNSFKFKKPNTGIVSGQKQNPPTR